MKKLGLVLIVLAALGTSPLLAADKGVGSPYTVHFDALALLFGELSVGGEFQLPVKNVSVAADVVYSPNLLWFTNISLLDLNVRGRYYLGDMIPFEVPEFLSFVKKGPLAGAFAGAGVSYHSWTQTWSSVKWSYLSLGLVGEVGSKYFLDNHFYLEGVLGLDLHLPSKWTVSDGSSSLNFSGSDREPSYLYSGVYAGYAF